MATAQIAVSNSTDRYIATATCVSGPAPCAISSRASLFDRALIAVTLGERLYEHELLRGLGCDRHLVDAHGEAIAIDRNDLALRERAPTVSDQGVLADSEPRNPHSMPRFVARDLDGGPDDKPSVEAVAIVQIRHA